MKIGVYNIVYDKRPKLNLIKKISAKKGEFNYDETIVNVLNRELLMNKLVSEHIYVVVFRNNLEPLGILQLGSGTQQECIPDLKSLGIGLLLLNGEQFMCFHNHPGGSRIITDSDKALTMSYSGVANLLSVNFMKHIMITDDIYVECKSFVDNEE